MRDPNLEGAIEHLPGPGMGKVEQVLAAEIGGKRPDQQARPGSDSPGQLPQDLCDQQTDMVRREW